MSLFQRRLKYLLFTLEDHLCNITHQITYGGIYKKKFEKSSLVIFGTYLYPLTMT